MKKSLYFIFAMALFVACDGAYEYNLKQMGKAVERHFMYNDLNNNISTAIDFVHPISYIELDSNQKETPEDFYLGEFYVKGKWSYLGSSLVYNMDDTISCYFDKNMKYLRTMKNIEEKKLR